jgi:hypothetical protein
MSDLIDALLAESELQDDLVLRDLLGDIERDATAVRPMPSAELMGLMEPRRVRSDRTMRRGPVAGRAVIITGIVVIGVLGLGAGAAAASPEARSVIGAGVAVIAHLFEPVPAGKAPAPPGGSTHSAGIGGTPEPSVTATPSPSGDTPGADHSNGEGVGVGSQNAGGSNSGESSAGHSDGSNSGDGHGNGKGNQSGHGTGTGQGDGGPAPTP